MGRGITLMAQLGRALFAPATGDTLTLSQPPPRGGRRMARRVKVRRVILIVFSGLALAIAGLGLYSLIWDSPQPPVVDEPVAPVQAAKPVGTNEFTQLAETDPVGMFRACLSSYAEKAKGFTAVLEKQERVAGTLHKREIIRITVWGEVSEPNGVPPAIHVRMIWEKGFRKDTFGSTVHGSLYPAGEHANQITVYRPDAWIKEWAIDSKGSLARNASRFCIRDSGIYRGMLRTYDAWNKRHEAGELKTEYLGIKRIEQTGNRECHVIRRICRQPEADRFSLDEEASTDPKVIARDGFSEVTVMIDVEKRLHLGTILRQANGELIGEYYFRDVQLLVTEPPPETFTVAGLIAATKS